MVDVIAMRDPLTSAIRPLDVLRRMFDGRAPACSDPDCGC
jgi:hypothetical protein